MLMFSGVVYLVIADPLGQGPGKATYNNTTTRATVVFHAGPMVVLSMRIDTVEREQDQIDVDDMIGPSGKVLHPWFGTGVPIPGDVVYYMGSSTRNTS